LFPSVSFSGSIINGGGVRYSGFKGYGLLTGDRMMTDADAWIGRTLADGRYEITRLLGQGGMGSVFESRDTRLETAVVVKFPHRGMLADPDFARRFEREIRSLIQLEHPHIVRINDVGDEDGMPYLVMPFLGGGSLEVRRPRGDDGRYKPIKPTQLRGWMSDVGKALDFIHQQGYIHRDIKPDNILFDKHQNVFISDFGIAKAIGQEAEKQTNLTGTGVIGTPGYIAPEILLGQPYDGRADQYALAVAVYEVLAGRRPFEGATPAVVIGMQARDDAPDLRTLRSSIPDSLAGVIMRALHREPDQRFPTCLAFAEALENSLKDLPAKSRKKQAKPGSQSGAAPAPPPLPPKTGAAEATKGAQQTVGTGEPRRTMKQPDLTPPLPATGGQHLQPTVPEREPTAAETMAASTGGTVPTGRTTPGSGRQSPAQPGRRTGAMPSAVPEGSELPRRRSSSLVLFWGVFAVLLFGGITGAVLWVNSQNGDDETTTNVAANDDRDAPQGLNKSKTLPGDDNRNRAPSQDNPPSQQPPGNPTNGRNAPSSGPDNASPPAARPAKKKVDIAKNLPGTGTVPGNGPTSPVGKQPSDKKQPSEKKPAPPMSRDERLAAIAPGTQWKGTEQAQGRAAEPFVLTFVEVREKGKYVRAIAQPGQSGGALHNYMLAVYEGVFQSSSNGRGTLVLKKPGQPQNGYDGSSGVFQYFATEMQLQFNAEGQLVGRANKHAVQLKPAGRLKPFPDAHQTAAAAVAPGTQWEGTLQHKTEAAQNVRLLFTERRDDGNYLRALAAVEGDPFNIIVLEGTLRTDDTYRHAYSMVFNKKTMGSNQSNSRLFNAFRASLELRLSFDGKTMYGITSGVRSQDQLKLTRSDPQPNYPSLDRKAFAQTIRKLCASGKRWVGSLQNTRAGQGVPLEAVFGAQNADGTSVQVVFRVPGSRVAVACQGTFRLDDVNVNAYCLELTKSTKGTSKVKFELFDNFTGGKVYIGLSPDTKTLYGYVKNHTERFVLRPPAAGNKKAKKKSSKTSLRRKR